MDTFKNVSEPRQQEKSYRCPCCRYKTLFSRAGYEICPVCFWEDDGQDDHDADMVRGGPNRSLSLTDARNSFATYRVSDTRFLANVRQPLPAEE